MSLRIFPSRGGQRTLVLRALVMLLWMAACTDVVVLTSARPTPPANKVAEGGGDGLYANVLFPETRKQHSLYLEELHPSLDEAGSDASRPLLVSVEEEASMFLPLPDGFGKSDEDDEAFFAEGAGRQGKEDEAHLTFSDDFDPIWYYALRRRGFETMELCGCGGKWRPEWSLPPPAGGVNASGVSKSTAQRFMRLKHALSHHVVCVFSSVSFCASSAMRSAEDQFQWAAQFISTLTSSPLSWSSETPRHIRPSGVLIPRTGRGNRRGSGTELAGSNASALSSWCSYHVVYHDTLCTQHVSPLLNAGRMGSGIQEGLPEGIFKAVIPSFSQLFSSPFQHFMFSVTQHVHRETEQLELRTHTRLSFVVDTEPDRFALARLWRESLPAHQRGLRVFIGPGGLHQRLQAALPSDIVRTQAAAEESEKAAARDPHAREEEEEEAGTERHVLDTKGGGIVAAAAVATALPELSYTVTTQGKDHGYVTVSLHHPVAVTADSEAALAADGIREGDLVRCLVLFPLHLLRPQLYNMESFLGATMVENVHSDTSSNTLAVLLKLKITAAHVIAYNKNHRGRGATHDEYHRYEGEDRDGGVLLARFAVMHSWAALTDLPRDANSHRIFPQPVAVIERSSSNSAAAAAEMTDAETCMCGEEGSDAVVVDHHTSVRQLLLSLATTAKGTSTKSAALTEQNEEDKRKKGRGCSCRYWLRSSRVSGTTIPGADPAMVFNVLALGLGFATVLTGSLIRMSRKLICKREDLETVKEQDH